MDKNNLIVAIKEVEGKPKVITSWDNDTRTATREWLSLNVKITVNGCKSLEEALPLLKIE